jgi:DNA-binding NarL/FixJ family response regulator
VQPLRTVELLILVSALAGLAVVWWHGPDGTRQAIRRLFSTLAAPDQSWTADARRWNNDAPHVLADLGIVMDRQFDRWALTSAERKIALLQVKGLSGKAIANLCNMNEGMVRQKATAIYRKSGLAPGTDIATFFFEDLRLPGDSSDREHPNEP